ncbi:MAG: Rha family transcriptional regulator [Verrucomicrobiota bacterium]
MSSVDIAKLTGKEHRNVLRDIKSTLEAANIDAPKFGGIYKDAYDREKPCCYLPKLELDLVVSGYSVPYRAS